MVSVCFHQMDSADQTVAAGSEADVQRLLHSAFVPPDQVRQVQVKQRWCFDEGLIRLCNLGQKRNRKILCREKHDPCCQIGAFFSVRQTNMNLDQANSEFA